jgi:hypothetical protein
MIKKITNGLLEWEEDFFDGNFVPTKKGRLRWKNQKG